MSTVVFVYTKMGFSFQEFNNYSFKGIIVIP